MERDGETSQFLNRNENFIAIYLSAVDEQQPDLATLKYQIVGSMKAAH